jgi:transcriptional regulator with XRE-family HTH domain
MADTGRTIFMEWAYVLFPRMDVEASCRRVGQIIDESGMTDKGLGRMMHLSVQSINKWRHGHNLPDIENLFILSRILDVKVDDFLVPVTQVVIEVETEEPANAVPRHLCYYKIKTQNIFFGARD